MCVMGCPQNCGAGTLRTCNEDCMAANANDVIYCTDLCEKCVNTLGCWTDATLYGDVDDFQCFYACYHECDTQFGSASTLCNCASHGACVLGCPSNCTSMHDTLKTCHVDCLRTGSYLASRCYFVCDTCVTTYGCWADVYYGSAPDYNCYRCCYPSCGNYWPEDSKLCICEQHGFCVLGCPHNCVDETLSDCNEECMTLHGAVACEMFCRDCVTDKGCWLDTDYGGATDVTCGEKCYTECGTMLPDEGEGLCNCSRGCIMGCP
jgi:hypothetical protein